MVIYHMNMNLSYDRSKVPLVKWTKATVKKLDKVWELYLII